MLDQISGVCEDLMQRKMDRDAETKIAATRHPTSLVYGIGRALHYDHAFPGGLVELL